MFLYETTKIIDCRKNCPNCPHLVVYSLLENNIELEIIKSKYFHPNITKNGAKFVVNRIIKTLALGFNGAMVSPVVDISEIPVHY